MEHIANRTQLMHFIELGVYGMSFIELLNGLKGKALDLRDLELLKSTYAIQEDNIKQWKDSNELLRDKINRLEIDNATLREQHFALESRVAELAPELGYAQEKKPPAKTDRNDCVIAIRSYINGHDRRGPYQPQNYEELDDLLNIARGSTKSLLVDAIKETEFVISRRGDQTFLLTPRPPEGPRVVGSWMSV